MNQNKKWFSLSLWREGMRQLRGITFLFSLAAAAYGILSILSIWVNYSRYLYSAVSPVDLPIVRNMPTAQPFLFLSFCIVAPILTLYLFRFLNSRRDSDFYHALPEKRICIFLSFFGAILSCLVIYMAVCVLSVVIPAGILSRYVSLAGKELLTYALHLFAASLYVSAFVAIAMALTGTFFSNVIVSGLLIFGPRILITVIKTLVMDYLPFVLTDRIGLLSNNYNVVNGIIFGLFGNNYSYSIVLNSPSAFWVTLAMGCILTVIAAVLFCHRPSEAAGKSAPNKVLGTVYRVSITYLASLLPVSSIFEHIINGTSYNRVSLYDLFIIYLLVVAVFYLYELFMTRSLRQLWKITPSLLWLPVLNVATILIMTGCYSNALSFTPAKEDINGVQILSERYYSWAYDSYCYDFYGVETEKLSLQDDAINELLARNLAEEVEALKNDDYYMSYLMTHSYAINVGLSTNQKTAYRSIHMTERDMDTLNALITDNDQIKAIYSHLPDENATGFQMRVNSDDIGKNSDLQHALYQALSQDMADLGIEDWYDYLKSNSYHSDYTLCSLQITTRNLDSLLTLYIPVTFKLSHTAEVYLGTLSHGSDSLQEYLDDLQTDGNTLEYVDVSCRIDSLEEAFDLESIFDFSTDESDDGEVAAYIPEYEDEEAAYIYGTIDYASLVEIITTLSQEAVTPSASSPFLVSMTLTWTDSLHGYHETDSILLGLNELPDNVQMWIANTYDVETDTVY